MPEYTFLVSPDFNPAVVPEGYIWDETAFQELVKATDKAAADQTIYTYGGPQGDTNVDYLNAADLTISSQRYDSEEVVATTVTANAFNNIGTVTTDGGIGFSVQSFFNSGTFALDKNASMTASSAVTNAKTGTINLNAGSTLQGSTIGNAGTITVVSDHAAINGAITNNGTIDAMMKKLIVTGDIQNANEDETAEARNNTVITAREFEVTGSVLNYGVIGVEYHPIHEMSVTGELNNYRQVIADVLTAGSIHSDGFYPEAEERHTRGYIIAGEVNAGSIDNVSGVVMSKAPKETAAGINVTGTINNGNADNVYAHLNAGINGWIQAASLNNIGTDIENSLIDAGKITAGDITNNGGISTRIVESTGTITNNETGLFYATFIDDPVVTGLVEAASINAGTVINGGTFSVHSEETLPTEITVNSIENNGTFEFIGAGFTLTGDVVNNTDAQIDVAGTVTSVTATITNSGTLNISNADDVSGILNIGAVTNAKTGTISLDDGSTLQGTGVSNAGTIEVAAGQATINAAIDNTGLIDAGMKSLTVTGDILNGTTYATMIERDDTVIKVRNFTVTGNVLNFGIIGTEMQEANEIDISGELRNYRQIIADTLTADSIYNDGIFADVEDERTLGYIIAGKIVTGEFNNLGGEISTGLAKEAGKGIDASGKINNGKEDAVYTATLQAGDNGWIQATDALNNIGKDSMIHAGYITVVAGEEAGNLSNDGTIQVRSIVADGTVTNNATGVIEFFEDAETPGEFTASGIENNGEISLVGPMTVTGDVANSSQIKVSGAVTIDGAVTNTGTITVRGVLTGSGIAGDGMIQIRSAGAVLPTDPIAVTADIFDGVIDLEVSLAGLSESSYQFVSGMIDDDVTFQVNGTDYKEGVTIGDTDYILTTKGGTGLWMVDIDNGMAGNTTVNAGGWMTVENGITVNRTTVENGGYLYVREGGVAESTVLNGGMWVYSGGTANGVTVNAGGSMTISEGGKVTGELTMENEAVVSASEGSVIDFNLFGLTEEAPVRVNDLSLIQGKPDYTITVSTNQASGTYQLSEGAAGFDKTVTIFNTAGASKTITVGSMVTLENLTCTLNLEDSLLSLTVSGGTPGKGPRVNLLENGVSQVLAWDAAQGKVGYMATNGNPAPSWQGVWEWTQPEQWKVAAAGKFAGSEVDHDGILLYNNSENTFAAWTNLDDPSYGYVSLCHVDGDFQTKCLGNFDGNGFDDVVVSNEQGSVGIVSDGSTYHDVWHVEGDSTEWQLLGAGTFDSTIGQDSLLFRHTENGHLYLWDNQGSDVGTWNWQQVDIGYLADGWEFAAIGDFAGDGIADIALVNTNDSNAVFVWDDGIQSTQHYMGVLGEGFKIESVGDYDGDGKEDLLLREYTTGWGGLGCWSGADSTAWIDFNAGIETNMVSQFTIVA